MKEEYVNPVIECYEYDAVDILTTSAGNDTRPDDNDVPFGE